MIGNRCLLCSAETLSDVSSFSLVGVTSDCKPWPRAGRFVVCRNCGHVQKKIDSRWLSEIKEIYAQYEMYPLSDGKEQVVFKGSSPIPRTSILLGRLQQVLNLPEQGRLLDIGCGNGAFLRTFRESYPQWRLFGFEQDGVFQKEVEETAGKGSFFSTSLETVHGKFDLITIIYVIEHLRDPVGIMKKARSLLSRKGNLLVQTSHFLHNPFDLVVVDHCSHFRLTTLIYCAELAGFKVKLEGDDWITKEIGLIANPEQRKRTIIPTKVIPASIREVENNLSWLNRVIEHGRDVSEKGSFGIFGTAIAGTWLANALGNGVSFFVDEDPLRHGKKHMGIPVLKPTEVPKGSSVYIAFAPYLATMLYERLSNYYPNIIFIVPPEK